MNRRTFVAGSAAALPFAGASREPGQCQPTTEITRREREPRFPGTFIRHAEPQDRMNSPNATFHPTNLPPDSGISYPLTQRGVEQADALAAS